GDAAVDDAVVVEWRAGDRVTMFIVLNRGLPDHLARLHVQSHDGGVELPEKQQPLTHRQTAVDPATAEGALPSETGPVLPKNFPRLGIERKDIVIACNDVHDAIPDQRRCLERVFGTEPGTFETGHPGPFELLDVGGVDLLQRRIALIGQVAAICHPVLTYGT